MSAFKLGYRQNDVWSWNTEVGNTTTMNERGVNPCKQWNETTKSNIFAKHLHEGKYEINMQLQSQKLPLKLGLPSTNQKCTPPICHGSDTTKNSNYKKKVTTNFLMGPIPWLLNLFYKALRKWLSRTSSSWCNQVQSQKSWLQSPQDTLLLFSNTRNKLGISHFLTFF